MAFAVRAAHPRIDVRYLPMDAADVFWLMLNLFLPAAGTGLLAAAAAKLVWRRELAGRRWHDLAVWAAAACALVTLAGLVLSGDDGRIATYGAMVAACALTLWWRGFRRTR